MNIISELGLMAKSDNFWGATPSEIHTFLLKNGYAIGIPQNEVYELISWAKRMAFVTSGMDYLDILIAHFRGKEFVPNPDGFGFVVK